MNKKILLVLVALLAIVFVFAGCENYNQEPIPTEDYSQYLVTGNGGMAVQQGNYLYFINGSAGLTAKNTFGEAEKGAIMRYKTDANGALVGDAVTIVPKVAYDQSMSGGIYIFGEWIYYVSPSTETNSEGVVQSSYVDFFRTKTNGTNTEKLITLTSNTNEYAFSKDALIYYYNGTLYSVKYETKNTEVIAENVTSYVIPKNGNYDAKSAKADVNGYVYYTKASEDISDFNNELWVAKFDNSYNEKVIGKYSYFSEAEQKQFENNQGEPDYTKIFRISPIKFENGVLYYTKNISENASSVNVGIYSYDMNNYFADKKFVASKETKWTELSTYTGIYTTENANQIIVTDSSKTWLLEKGKIAVELFPELKTILAVKGGYMYYYSSSSKDIYKMNLTTEEEDRINAIKVTETTPDVAWLPVEMVGDYIYYVNAEYSYVYRINTKLEKGADGYNVMLGKYSAEDQKLVDAANDEE